MRVLVDVTFKGQYSKVSLEFLALIIPGAREIRFNNPDTQSGSVNEIHSVINSHSFIDLVIGFDKINLSSISIPDVFFNLVKDEEAVDLLLFFDLMDIDGTGLKQKLDNLRVWMTDFAKQYKFDHFKCEPDAHNEYFFDDQGFGKLHP